METQHKSTKKKANQKTKTPTKQQKLWVYGLGIGALFGGGYLLYNYFQNRAGGGDTVILNPRNPTTSPPRSLPATNPIVTQNRNQFPLKKGARGSVVTLLQKGLLAIGGSPAALIRSTSMRGNTPDGVFGPGTIKALLAAGFPTTVTEAVFSRLLSMTNSSSGGTSPSQSIAATISKGANERNLFSVLAGLQKIQDAKGYSHVSSFFKNVRITGTRVTSLVNALLSVAFRTNEPAKIKIRAEFRRMGLSQNNRGIWSIPSLGSIETTAKLTNYLQEQQRYDLAVTDRPTLLKTADGSFITPPLNPNTVVGYVTASHNGITKIIAANGETVYAPSGNLRLL